MIEKKCSELVSDEKRVTHVPLGASLHEDGHLYFDSVQKHRVRP